jgi:GlpG protein
MSDHTPATHRPLLTYSLIAASVLVAVISRLGDSREVLAWLILADPYRFDGSLASGLEGLQQGQLWRLFTPILIHFGIIHLLFNMLWLKDLGGLIETRWSRRTLAALVIVSAALSNLGQYLVNWDLRNGLELANVWSGGMSGVVYCLLGYVWIRGRHEPGLRLHPQIVALMLGWLVLCFTGLLGPIGNTAHLLGLLIGVGWGRIAVTRTRIPDQDR